MFSSGSDLVIREVCAICAAGRRQIRGGTLSRRARVEYESPDEVASCFGGLAALREILPGLKE